MKIFLNVLESNFAIKSIDITYWAFGSRTFDLFSKFIQHNFTLREIVMSDNTYISNGQFYNSLKNNYSLLTIIILPISFSLQKAAIFELLKRNRNLMQLTH
eukprot:TRINITY_DN375_c1_g2_i1.p1 TRINITY_DN375_c1_g2~~TRINITY_DN375_c1_g2_i1.p1  ORF type:complete len:101 (+),score=10.39 TRINITY_DN375_c1_g2_i1:249-551(+)